MKVQEENHTSAFSLPCFLQNCGLTERAQWPPLTEQWSWVHSSCLHSLWPPHSGIYMAHQLPSLSSMVRGHVSACPPCTHASGHGKCMPHTLLFPAGPPSLSSWLLRTSTHEPSPLSLEAAAQLAEASAERRALYQHSAHPLKSCSRLIPPLRSRDCPSWLLWQLYRWQWLSLSRLCPHRLGEAQLSQSKREQSPSLDLDPFWSSSLGPLLPCPSKVLEKYSRLTVPNSSMPIYS